MSLTGKPGLAPPKDHSPGLPPAGMGPGADQFTRSANSDAFESTARALKPEVYEKPPPTPEYMRKWRKDAEPGKPCLHPGTADDVAFERLPVYGRPEPVGVKVHEVLNMEPASAVAAVAAAKKEAVYLSNKREPLGKPYSRGHQLPEQLMHSGFGRPTPQDVSGDASKELLHPREAPTDPRDRELYIKSHANFAPGEQRQRGYQWVDKEGQIDPKNFSFGADVKPRESNGVAKSLNPTLDGVREQVVVSKKLEEHREIHSEPLGRCKYLGHGVTTPDNHVFGVPSQRAPEWGVRECMVNYSPEDQQPDPDLGRSARQGLPGSEANRVFGTPTIRKDIPAPTVKSVADHQNYGDEVPASSLLYPPPFIDSGVSGEDFLEARSQQEIAEIFELAGEKLAEDQLAAIFAKATTLDPHGRVSLESFRRTLNGDW